MVWTQSSQNQLHAQLLWGWSFAQGGWLENRSGQAKSLWDLSCSECFNLLLLPAPVAPPHSPSAVQLQQALSAPLKVRGWCPGAPKRLRKTFWGRRGDLAAVRKEQGVGSITPHRAQGLGQERKSLWSSGTALSLKCTKHFCVSNLAGLKLGWERPNSITVLLTRSEHH